MNLPMYASAKQILPLLSILLEIVILKKPRPTYMAFTGVFLVAVGAAMATLYDLYPDRWSILYGFLSAVSLTIYLTFIKRCSLNNEYLSAVSHSQKLPRSHAKISIFRHGVHEQYSTAEIIYINSIHCLLIFLAVDVVQNESQEAYMYLLTTAGPPFWFCLLVLIAFGTLMQFTQVTCVVSHDATCTALATCGAAAATSIFAQNFVWFVVFRKDSTLINHVGIVMCFVGQVLFWYALST